ncbi:MAG: helix-turn-helix domain-containing protein [bacterium]|nr:helix-turn-helix domain-containing protein [bacterium]
MELRIGTKIMELRKAKGLTQEQLAAALGVSAPAVSKWETDNSYPDITLLCPLARALGTNVDDLLTFEEGLSQESLGQYMTEIIELARQGEAASAEEKLRALLHRYPSDIPLKFSAIGALSFLEMNAALGMEGSLTEEHHQGSVSDRERWAKWKKELAQALHDSGDPAYYFPSVSMLVSLCLASGEFAEAEKLLRENVTETGDFTALWVRLYLKKGEREQAWGTLQRQTYKLVSDLRVCLVSLLEEELGLEPDRVMEICRILEQIDSMFSIGGNMGSGVLAEVYLRIGRQEEALAYLEKLADQINDKMAPPNPLVFAPAIAPEPEKLEMSRELKLAVLQGLERDACFAPLRDQERFQQLVCKVADSLNQ